MKNRLIFRVLLLGSLALASFNAFASPASGYWWNTSQAGRGFVIEIQGSQMFMAGFLYDTSGRSSWVASSGPMTSPTFYSGSLITYSGGQTLNGAYKGAPTISAPLGTITISFTSDTQATVTWPGGTLPIQRFDIVPGGSSASQPSTNPQPGWWWNTAEGGRGFAIEVQNGSMYLAAYMYDSSGNSVWFLANGDMTSPGLFQGQWTQYSGGQTLTGPYKPPNKTTPVGAVTLQIVDPTSAILTLPNEEITLSRYNFGVSAPTLAAFSPASAAPNSLLNMSGSNIDPTAALTMTLFNSTGYAVTVPLASASATSLKFSVPVYVNIASSAFGSGTVNLKLTQSKNGASADSNTLAGFGIQALPAVPGTAGSSTLSLIQANLQEAQKLQTSIKGTAQDTQVVNAALAQQVSNLQSLVTNVLSVIQNSTSFTLGIVGGLNITVTPTNIGQVDSFILATLQSLANPGTGAKGAEAAGSGCMGAEAVAFANAITSGNTGAFKQLAINLIEAPGSSAACNTAIAFTAAYQIFGGASSTGVGVTNQASLTGGITLAGGPALFAATSTNSNTAIGLNALLSPQLAAQTSAVQSGIGSVSALAKPITDQLLSNTTGDFVANVGTAQNLILTVAPPPSSNGPLSVSGSYVGSATATSKVCGDNSSLNLVGTVVAQGTSLSGTLNGTAHDSGSGVSFTGTYNASTQTWSISGGKSGGTTDDTVSITGTLVGTVLSGSFVDTQSPTDPQCPSYTTNGVFALTRQ